MPCARPYGYLGCATLFHGVEECGGLPVRLENDVFVAALVVVARRHLMAHVGRLVAVAVGYRPADALLAEARRRAEAVGLRGCEVEVDGVALLLLLVGRAGARDVDLEADAHVVERVDPFAGLVRVDEVDDGFACGGFACDVVPRLERRLTAHASHSAMFAAYVVGAGGLLGGDAWARGEDRRLARGG